MARVPTPVGWKLLAIGVAAVAAGVPRTTITAVLSHADISTTAIYTTALGAEARERVSRVW